MNLMALTALRMRTATMLAMMMVVMFASSSGAWAQNAGVVATVQSTGQQQPVEYTDLEAAFAAAKNNDVITLLAHCNLVADDTHTGRLVVGNGTDVTNVEFNLNGYTVQGSADNLITVTTNAYLTIVDGKGAGLIATSGEKAILNAGALTLSDGSVRGRKYGIYSQGNVSIGGGSVAGNDCAALYVEQGNANISGGTFKSSGTGIESQSDLYLLGLPTFDCTVADISLAQDKKIEFNSGSYAKPVKKIRVKVANEAPYMFTSNYDDYVTDAAGDPIAPEDLFVSADYGEGVIGYIYDNYHMTYEAGIATLTEVAFPAGKSTYFDSRALALYGTNDNLKFYGIKGLSGSTVQLGEITSKRFGEHSAVIVSNTSDAPITAKMVVAFEGPMASSFGNAANTDLGVLDFPPVFLDGTDVELTEIQVPDGYKTYELSDNRFLILESDATAEAHSGWLVADMSKVPDIGYLTIRWPDGKTTGEIIAMDSPVNLEYNGATQACYPLAGDVAAGLVRNSIRKHSAQSGEINKNNVFVTVNDNLNPDAFLASLHFEYKKDKARKAVLKVVKKNFQGGKLQLVAVVMKGTKLTIKTKGGKLKLSSKEKNKIKKLLKKEGIKVTKIKTVKATRGVTLEDDDEELEFDPDVEYEVLEDCNLFFDLEFDDDADGLEIEGVTFRNPGDANGDDKVDAADIVEMENAKAGNPSQCFIPLNADINDDDDITDDDVDVVVDLIVDE